MKKHLNYMIFVVIIIIHILRVRFYVVKIDEEILMSINLQVYQPKIFALIQECIAAEIDPFLLVR